MKTRDFIQRCVTGSERAPRGGWKAVSSVGWDGEHVYSYGFHYPLLVQLQTARGRFWILNDSGYSSTTGRHIHWARDFAAGKVHMLSHAGSYGRSPLGIKEAAELEIKRNRETIKEAHDRAELRPRYASTYLKTAAHAEERIKQLEHVISLAEEAEAFSPTFKN